ncbi:hypothetical protein [Nocardia paucivorans]|uniref:hypothetical protein n=1 Tax=Nocardia paucivorans TaxID=114259 RepID=UPI001FE1007E|nr:hypothetical protein [Nocardia paucivorans]
MLDDPNLDPEVEAMARRVLNAADDLETASLRVERTVLEDLWRDPILVNEGLMSALAAIPNASPELKAYAARVEAGECRWPEIELMARPVPPEVAELKNSPSYAWTWDIPEPVAEPTPPPQRKKAPGVVGPTDWPDDFDEYPTQRTWLV